MRTIRTAVFLLLFATVAMLCGYAESVALAAAPVRVSDGAPNLSALFEGAGLVYGIDPALLSAIARVESDYSTHALSRAGAEGIMQLMPATAARYGVKNAFNPVDNVLGAARFLHHLKHSNFDNGVSPTLPELLAAYNAGPDAVRRFRGIPPYRETREYVRRVLWLYLAGYVPDQGAAPPSASTVLPRATVSAHGDVAILDKLDHIRHEREHLLSQAGYVR